MISSVAAGVPWVGGSSRLAHQINGLSSSVLHQTGNQGQHEHRDTASLTIRLKAVTVLCLGVVMATLCMSLIGFITGLIAYSAIGNQTRGSFWAHVTVLVGSASAIMGLKRRTGKWIFMGLLFNILSMVLTFCGAIVDGLAAGRLKDIDFEACSYATNNGAACNSSSLVSSLIFTEIGLARCRLQFDAGSCYCCQVYQQACDGGSMGQTYTPYYFTDISSCDYLGYAYLPLLWVSTVTCSATFVLLTVGVALCAHYVSCLSKVVPSSSSQMGRHSEAVRPPTYSQARILLPPPYEEDVSPRCGDSAMVAQRLTSVSDGIIMAPASTSTQTPGEVSRHSHPHNDTVLSSHAASLNWQRDKPPPYSP